MNEAAWAQKFCQKIKEFNLKSPVRVMEVCGTHTMNIARYALRSLLPAEVKIIAGPGCPVCVTDPHDLALAFAAIQIPHCIVATFGDVLRLPFNGQTLGQAPNVVAVSSPAAAVTLAAQNPSQEVIFLGIGFETTAPLTAAAVMQAQAMGLPNFSILSWHKLIVPALEFLLSQEALKIDGFLLPGHVAAVTGSDYFAFLNGRRPAVIAGFSAPEISAALAALVQAIGKEDRQVKNFYPHVVHPEGNQKAMHLMGHVFMPQTARWHGIGMLPESGLQLRPVWAAFDAQKKFGLIAPPIPPSACRCGEIMLGQITPPACALFGKQCTPSMPQGPCMVSSEGTCAAYYRYQR